MNLLKYCSKGTNSRSCDNKLSVSHASLWVAFGLRSSITSLLLQQALLIACFAETIPCASPASPPVLGLAPGAIAVISSAEPSRFSFDKPTARIESASEGAGDAVSALLQTPSLGNPQIEACIGIVQFAATPFVASYAALAAGHRKLSADQLSELEQQFTSRMSSVAEQDNLRQLVVASARDITHRQIAEVADILAVNTNAQFSGILETRVQSIELKRLHKANNYCLCIAAQARLLNVLNRTVLSQREFNYQSEPAMFIDWARLGGLESVANTGFRVLAHRIAQEFFSPDLAQPLFVGLGSLEILKRMSKAADHKADAPFQTGLSSSGSAQIVAPGLQTDRVMLASLKPRLIDYHTEVSTAFEVLPDTTRPEVFIRTPKTKSAPEPETLTDTEWALDGLENHCNFVVQLGACISSIPIGLWEHTVGAIRQGPRADLQRAQSLLEQITWHRPVQQMVADEIAQTLAVQTSQRVVLRKLPLPAGQDLGANPYVKPVVFGSEPGLQGRGPAAADEILHVRVLNIALDGSRRQHSGMRLSLDAEVSLLRKSDGQELRSFPVRYRGAAQQLGNWSANNGLIFKQELEACSAQIANALVQRLLSEGYVIPLRTPGSSLAKN